MDVNARLRRNLNDFSANYALCVVAVVALTLLAHPDSLIVCLLLSGAWVALITRGSEPLVIQGRTISRDQQFAGAAVLSLGARRGSAHLRARLCTKLCHLSRT